MNEAKSGGGAGFPSSPDFMVSCQSRVRGWYGKNYLLQHSQSDASEAELSPATKDKLSHVVVESGVWGRWGFWDESMGEIVGTVGNLIWDVG